MMPVKEQGEEIVHLWVSKAFRKQLWQGTVMADQGSFATPKVGLFSQS